MPTRLDIIPGVPIGPDVVTKRLALLGHPESGKSNALSVMAEELVPLGAPVILIDGVGNLNGLRSSADGLRPGLPIAIFGGERYDVPLNPAVGAAVAREIVAARASAIIDVSEFGEDEARGFVADFVLELYRFNRQPVHLLIDEAHEWAPEHPQTSEHYRCRSAVVKVRKLGRNRGIGSTLATQSAAELAKAALNLSDALFALRTLGPGDVAKIVAWVKGRLPKEEVARILRTLAELKVGEAWCISPGWLGVTKRARFRLRHTFDSTRTPTLGDEVREPAVWAEVDLQRITRAIEADAAGEVKPVVVARAIAPPVRVEIPVPVLADGQLAELRAIAATLTADVESLTRSTESTGTAVRELTTRLATLDGHVAPSTTPATIASPTSTPATIASPTSTPATIASPTSTPARSRGSEGRGRTAVAAPAKTPARAPAAPTSPRARAAGARPPADAPALKAGMVRMLVALRRVGRALTRRELGTLANISHGSTMSEYVTTLASAGYVVENGGVQLTSSGAAVVADAEARPPRTKEIVELHSPHLKAGQLRILSLLIDTYPKRLRRAVLSAQANVKHGSTMSEYVTGLKSRGLIVEDREGGARAANILFIARKRMESAE